MEAALSIRILIECTYACVGGQTLVHQTVGLPMGINPAPLFADLYCWRREFVFLQELVSSKLDRDRKLARRLYYCWRFTDDLLILSVGIFDPQVIYSDLKIKKENKSYKAASFLDMGLSIVRERHKRVNRYVVRAKLYDTRDDLPSEVIRFPYRKSDIHRKTLLDVVLSTIIRVYRVSGASADFMRNVRQAAAVFSERGLRRIEWHTAVRKFATRYHKFRKLTMARKIFWLRLSESFGVPPRREKVSAI